MLIKCLLQDQQPLLTSWQNIEVHWSPLNHTSCVHAILANTDPVSKQDNALLSDDPITLLDNLLSDLTPADTIIEPTTEQDFQVAH